MDMDVLVNLLKELLKEWPTLVLAGSAFVVAFLSPWVRDKYFSRKLFLDSGFGVGSPYSHQTIITVRGTNDSFPVYYFLFSVRNKGKMQADDCEAVLERVWEIDGAGNKHEWKSFLPVNLKWSGEDPRNFERACFKTIYPGERRVFCDIGHIYDPEYVAKYKVESVYRGISEEERQKNKFFFESLQKFYYQWDCLVPGKYQIQISVYSKNAAKKTRKFNVSWSGKWEGREEEMFREIVMS